MTNNIEYANQCYECLHYRKEITSMQSELLMKDNEIQSVFDLYNELKDVHTLLTKENESLKEQLKCALHDKKEIENKLQHEINRLMDMNSLRNKELQIHSISKLNEMNIKAKLAAQIESKYIADISDKENEIEILTKKVNELQLENNKYKCEYESIQRSSQDEIERLRNKHENDIKDLMNKIEYLNTSVNPTSSVIQSKSLKEIENEINEQHELRLQLETVQSQLSSLNSVISTLKSEKEELQNKIDSLEAKHQLELNYTTDSYRNIQNKLLLNKQQLTQCEDNLKQSNSKLDSLETKYKLLKEDNDCLQKVNDELIKSNSFYKRNIELLRKQLHSQDKQYADVVNDHKQILKQTLSNNETNLNTYKDTIHALKSENDTLILRQEMVNRNMEQQLKTANKKVEMLNEEIRILKKEKGALQNENEIMKREHADKEKEAEYYKNEYGILNKQHKVERKLLSENKNKVDALYSIIRNKNIEIEQLKQKLNN